MRRVLTAGSFLALALFGLYYIFTIFSTPPGLSTSGTRSEGLGVAVAQPISPMPMSYPVEDFINATAYKVVRVIDGDTVNIDYNGKVPNVRLIGVDTPETVHPNKPVEAYGKEASNIMGIGLALSGKVSTKLPSRV